MPLKSPNLVEADEGKRWRNLAMEVMKEEDVLWQEEEDLRNPQRLPIQIQLLSLSPPNPVHLSHQAQQDVCVPPASHHLKIRG